MDYPHKKRAWALAFSIFYLGGMCGSWLAMTWHDFTLFPYREIGALLWPLLITGLLGSL